MWYYILTPTNENSGCMVAKSSKNKRFVDVETPYASDSLGEVATHIRYTRACVRDCLLRGEIPFASHLLYTQSGILDDNLPKERNWGILAGKELIAKLNATTVVYTDLGSSKGMELGIEMAKKSGRPIMYRSLGKGWEKKFLASERKHSHNRIWLYYNGDVNLTVHENETNLELIKLAIENRLKELKETKRKK